MSAIYFQKEIVSNSVVVSGKRVGFEVLDGNRGIIKLDTEKDRPIVEGLLHLANSHKGGVVLINEAEYTQKKTQFPYQPSALKPKEFLRAVPTTHNPFAKRGSAAVASRAPSGPLQEEAAPAVEQLPAPTTSRPNTARVRRGKLAEAMQRNLRT